jgi:acyl transferase domain-containing protein
MVVLKRLDDAIRDGDQIRAVIRNSGVNHDGKTTGITLPSRISQESLIRTVYGQVALDPKDTPYIEAHGTGTAVGDDEEISAIRAVFEESQADPEEDPLYVGTIKPNIGHLESVSGLAGFIKAVLMIERGKIPPNVNLKVLKKILNLDTSRVQVS